MSVGHLEQPQQCERSNSNSEKCSATSALLNMESRGGCLYGYVESWQQLKGVRDRISVRGDGSHLAQ